MAAPTNIVIVAIEFAVPRDADGKSSEARIHGIGPTPREKAAKYPTTALNASQPRCGSDRRKKSPSNAELSAIPNALDENQRRSSGSQCSAPVTIMLAEPVSKSTDKIMMLVR